MVDFSFHKRRYSRDDWHLILVPTEQCNFSCTYCY